MDRLGHGRGEDQPDRGPTRRFFADPQLGKAIHANGHEYHRAGLDNGKGQPQIAREKRDRGHRLLRKGRVTGQGKAGVPARVPMIKPATGPVIGKEDVDIGIIGIAVGAKDAERAMIEQRT